MRRFSSLGRSQKVETRKYDTFLSSASTGDLVLFGGTGMFSRIISTATGSRYSHVAMVLKNENSGELRLLESVRHSCGSLDIKRNSRINTGVRLVDAREKLRNYPGKTCVWRRLTGLRSDVSHKVKRRLWDCVDKYHGVAYEVNGMQTIRAFFEKPSMLANETQDLSSIFCSELIAQCYMDAGLINPSTTPSNGYIPGDFSMDGSLPWVVGGVNLSTEIEIMKPSNGLLSDIPFSDMFCGAYAADAVWCLASWTFCRRDESREERETEEWTEGRRMCYGHERTNHPQSSLTTQEDPEERRKAIVQNASALLVDYNSIKL